ncbi:hypothetical protein [Cellulomonas olei]|uniref:hypothetical protein n=1 Tax=Cellulomonas sp. P4 TaxID=3142533 RepID=UPI0031BA7883
MGRQLIENVLVRHPDTGEVTTLYAGHDVPDWASKVVTNPKVWADAEDPDTDSDAGTVVIPDGDPTNKWKVDQLTAYADMHGVDLDGAKKKDAILAALAAAKDATTSGAAGAGEQKPSGETAGDAGDTSGQD